MIEKCVFPSVSVWVRHEEPGNYTHLISLPRSYSLIANSSSSFRFWDQKNAFHLLVVSTVSTFSTVSCQVSKHFAVLFTAYTTHGQCVLLLTSATLTVHTQLQS